VAGLSIIDHVLTVIVMLPNVLSNDRGSPR